MPETWILIPARGGSKGIPGKNLRSLAGRPLILHAVETAREFAPSERVLVSTDDEAIANVCGQLATTVPRSAELAGDEATLDQVAEDIARQLVAQGASDDDILLTVQPTSPFITAETLRKAVAEFETGAGSVLTVVDDRHLRWTVADGVATPLFTRRVNRQWLEPQLAETGGVIGARLGAIVESGTRIIEPVHLIEVDHVEGLDIDDFADWAVAEFFASRRRIVIRADGGRALGMGHLYRALALHHEFAHHDVRVVTRHDEGRELGREFLRDRLGTVDVVSSEQEFLDLLDDLKPDVVVTDILDTAEEYMIAVKSRAGFVVSIEDAGAGSRVADLVINDLYTDAYPADNHRYGVRYAILGPQFEHVSPIPVPSGPVARVLVTFGGSDPGCLTLKALEALSLVGFTGDVVTVLGPGYAHGKVDLEDFGLHGEVLSSITDLAIVMHRCDLAITSAGRTVTELMTQGVPTLALCQNQREVMHSHASSPFGVANLGLGEYVDAKALASHLSLLIADAGMRASMHDRMLKAVKERSNRAVADLIMDAAEKKRSLENG